MTEDQFKAYVLVLLLVIAVSVGYQAFVLHGVVSGIKTFSDQVNQRMR